jgi:hypothetical protein
VLVWAVLLAFVGLLIASAAQLAAERPDYADQAKVLINQVVTDLGTAGLVSGQLSDLVGQIEYGQIVGPATGLLSQLMGCGQHARPAAGGAGVHGRSSPAASVLGVVPPALLGLAGGWGEFVSILVVCSLLDFVVQTLVQHASSVTPSGCR